MLSKKILDCLNDQVNKELYSAYLYLQMASYAASIGLNGFANWFTVQIKEELIHAEKFYNYVIQQGGRVIVKEIPAPPKNFSSAADLFKKTIEHEHGVSKRIHNLLSRVREEGDHATDAFLQWFVTEQVEEEASAVEIMQKIDLVGGDGNGLFMIDNQLAARVFIPPQQAAQA